MKAAGVYLVLGLVAVIALLILLNHFDPGNTALRQTRAQLAREEAIAMAPTWLMVKHVLAITVGAVAGSIALMFAAIALVALGSVPNGITATWVRAWLVKPNRNSMYPALAEPNGQGHIRVVNPPNEPRAQIAAAFGSGIHDGARLQTGVARQLLRQDDPQAMLPEPTSLPEYTPEQVIEPDPQNKPDVLVVGQKGSGKTNVLRWLIDAYRKTMPDAEFLIMSPISSNWGLPETITQPEDIRRAVLALRDEMDRRDAAMKEAGIRDYHRWPDAPRRLVVVIDEAEAVADMIKLESTTITEDGTKVNGAAKAKEFAGTLRVVVNMGRNFGYLIIQGTQTARADVMDSSFMHNAATLIMMRMDAATAARFAEYDRQIVAELPTMPRGRAYCPQAGGYINFPYVDTLRAPRMSSVYKVPMQLPADAESDGLGDDDLPDGDYSSTTVVENAPQNGQNGTYSSVVATGSRSVVAPVVLTMEQRIARIPKDGPPRDVYDSETLYNLWLAVGKNCAEVERQVYNYDGGPGGSGHYYAAQGINAALRRRHLAPRYKEKE